MKLYILIVILLIVSYTFMSVESFKNECDSVVEIQCQLCCLAQRKFADLEHWRNKKLCWCETLSDMLGVF